MLIFNVRKNIVGNAVSRMRGKEYFCSTDCSSIYLRIVSMRNNNNSLMDSIAGEMKAIISASIAKEIQFVSSEVKQVIATIEKSQEFLSAKFDEIVNDVRELKMENEKLKAEIEYLKKSQSQLQNTTHNLEANVDRSDKAALNNNAVVWGIPTATGENVGQLINRLLCCLGLGDKSGLVLSAERMFTNNNPNKAPVPIRVVFRDQELKEEVFNKKKQFGKLLSTAIDEKFIINGKAMNVTLRDELTPLSLELLKDLRESQGLLNIRYVWAGRGGTILAKRDDSSKPEMVKTRVDLNRVKSHSLMATHVFDTATAAGHSSSPHWKKSVC